jgi:hypothetical protein
MPDLERRAVTEPVRGHSGTLAEAKGPTILRASDLDDATLEEITRGMVERWRPQMKVYFVGLAVGSALSFGAVWGMVNGLVPPGVVTLANLPLLTLTPFILWKQKQLQNDEADRVGVSRALLTKMWSKQFLMGFRPKVVRDMFSAIPKALLRQTNQHELIHKYMRMARDELAAAEAKHLPAARDGVDG